jgi:phosphatidylglycerophosphate synthase
VYATLILPDALDTPDFLGMPVVLRVALGLQQAGATGLRVFGEGATRVCAALAADERVFVPVAIHAEGEPVAWVCRADALIAPDALRDLPAGDAIVDRRGVKLAVRLAPDTATPDPVAALNAAMPTQLVPPRYALSLRDPEDRRSAERLLFAALIKPSDGPVSRHFNRHVSRAITRLVLPLGMTPNVMTVFVAISGLLGAYYASFAGYGYQLLGAALYQLHSIIDGCDGEIARLTQRFGKHGALIDSLVDDLCNGAFFVGLSIGVSRSLGVDWPLVTGAVTGMAYVGVIGVQYGVVLRATGRGDKTKFWQAPADRGFSLFAVFKAALRRDVFVALILVAVALGLAPAAVAVFPFSALAALIASSVRVLRGTGHGTA